jgi:hypothetical protein
MKRRSRPTSVPPSPHRGRHRVVPRVRLGPTGQHPREPAACRRRRRSVRNAPRSRSASRSNRSSVTAAARTADSRSTRARPSSPIQTTDHSPSLATSPCGSIVRSVITLYGRASRACTRRSSITVRWSVDRTSLRRIRPATRLRVARRDSARAAVRFSCAPRRASDRPWSFSGSPMLDRNSAGISSVVRCVNVLQYSSCR